MALVLGIETSCDETAVGIVDDRKLLANVISSSVAEHARFGGVVPEVASRAHLESMQQMIKQALADAKVRLSDWARVKQAMAIMLEMRLGNDQARPLYESFGFSEVSKRENYYGPGLTAVVMRKELM